MKKYLLISIMSLMTLASFGRESEAITIVSEDTLYYNQDLISVEQSEDAAYYRLMGTQGNGFDKREVFCDYYLNGKMKQRAGYKFLDMENDKNTVLDGEVVTYYKNGKEKWRCNYVNGKRNGYFTVQMRDGGIGVVEYVNGVSKLNYMMITHPDGTMEKRPFSKCKGLLQ